MNELHLVERFFTTWISTCEERLSDLLENWDRSPFYTANIFTDPCAIIEGVATKLGFKCYCGYYSIDAVLFKPEDYVPRIPIGQTWIRRIRIAFEHENDFGSGLFQEVSHLLITDCDLRVVVSYAGETACRDDELNYLHGVIKGSDRSAQIANDSSFLFIIGNRDPAKTKAIWSGYVYQQDDWKRLDLQAPHTQAL